ncbi:MAG: hypothetical protein ACQEQ0_02125 [Bacteroidota bacterium]
MHKIIRYSLLFFALLISVSSFSQKRTYSPFSRYGVGELSERGFGQNAAMGNTGIGHRDKDHLNNLNPASYSAIDSTSFFFEAGISGFNQTFESEGNEEKYNNIDFSYFAMGFPLSKKFHTSLGLKPFSNTGYKFEFSDANTLNRAIGTGNLSSAYGGLSFRPSPNLSIGAHATYLFGNIRHTTFIEFSEDQAAYKYGVQSELHASDFFFDFGAQYTKEISNSRSLTLGATFRPQTPINGDFQRTVAKGFQYDEDGKLFTSNQVIEAASDSSDIKSFDIPQSLGFGVSYKMNKESEELLLNADYIISNWGDITLPDGHSNTTNSSHLMAGAQYIPNKRSQSYLGRMSYRAGIKYKQEYIKINDQQINDFGITFGIGLPLSRSKTSVNMAFELGKRTPSADNKIMSENYGKMTLNFTFHELWFRQRKFD